VREMASRMLADVDPVARVWSGQMLSGSELIVSASRKEELYKAYDPDPSGSREGKILGFEMEISGAVRAALRASKRTPIAIKGVMDDGTSGSRELGKYANALKDALQTLSTINSARVFNWLVSANPQINQPDKQGVCANRGCLSGHQKP
jgi:hypothetical protein